MCGQPDGRDAGDARAAGGTSRLTCSQNGSILLDRCVTACIPPMYPTKPGSGTGSHTGCVCPHRTGRDALTNGISVRRLLISPSHAEGGGIPGGSATVEKSGAVACSHRVPSVTTGYLLQPAALSSAVPSVGTVDELSRKWPQLQPALRRGRGCLKSRLPARGRPGRPLAKSSPRRARRASPSVSSREPHHGPRPTRVAGLHPLHVHVGASVRACSGSQGRSTTQSYCPSRPPAGRRRSGALRAPPSKPSRPPGPGHHDTRSHPRQRPGSRRKNRATGKQQ